MKLFLKLLLVIILFASCANDKPLTTTFSFYHWKSNAVFPKSYEKALSTSQTKTIYLHYFDLKVLNRNDWNHDGIYPVYTIKKIDKAYKNFEIIPVIYINNSVFKDRIDIDGLANRTSKLINQISIKHFNKKTPKIQIDCDWTASTKIAYFEFLKSISRRNDVSVTIRLHQIKFKEKTGVPPVDSGTLMMYNIGDLKNANENSILENKIVKQYINTETTYPLKLNVALPLFSQTIVRNNDDEIRIIKNSKRKVLETDKHFKKIDNTNFEVEKDTLFHGFYLTKGYRLKVEETNSKEIVSAYKTIKNSKLITEDVIFYHLDESSLTNVDFKKLVHKL